MKKILFIVFIAVTSCNAQFTIQQAFPNLTFSSPLDIQNCGDDRLFVVERSGIIKVFPNISTVTTTKVFLDITDRVSSGGEMGLLGLAFHPNYAQNGYFYVNYTVSSPTRATRISRFQVTSNPDSANKSSELILLTFNQPYTNHNGGQVTFGPDGYLYIATGDGGSGGDPQNNSQNKSSLLGKILRIDVNNQSPGLQYAIPPTNPFANNTQGYKEEIYAYGLRNPWRISFDYEDGKLWCADVGQTAREEIDIIINGGNYGWRCYEGNLPYNTSGCGPSTDYIFPIFDYPRSEGISVTGGFVYRGPSVPELWGKYIYGDYGSTHIWSLAYDGVNPPTNIRIINNSGRAISSFGVDRYNELYIADLSGGKIWKFTPTATIQPPTNLIVSIQLNGQAINLNWIDNASNETGYKVERRALNGSFQEIASLPANANNYNDTNFNDTTYYEYRVRAFNTTAFSGYSNVAGILTPIPVELVYFNAALNNSSVTLSWKTASETNNKGFEVQRNLNGLWENLTFIRGGGTTSTGQSYSYTDNLDNLTHQTVIQYRLRQVDFDGKENYSNIIEVDFVSGVRSFELKQNYPNPFYSDGGPLRSSKSETRFEFVVPVQSRVSLKLFDLLGGEIDIINNEIKDRGIYNYSWNANGMAAGVYFLVMKAESLDGKEKFNDLKKVLYLK